MNNDKKYIYFVATLSFFRYQMRQEKEMQQSRFQAEHPSTALLFLID